MIGPLVADVYGGPHDEGLPFPLYVSHKTGDAALQERVGRRAHDLDSERRPFVDEHVDPNVRGWRDVTAAIATEVADRLPDVFAR
jgi:hypothetical protein